MYECSEDILVEQPTIDLFTALGYETANTFHEKFGKLGTLRREMDNEVVLVPRLRVALQQLNPDLPHEAIELPIEELTPDRSSLTPANANHEIYQLLKQGIPICISAGEDEELVQRRLEPLVNSVFQKENSTWNQAHQESASFVTSHKVGACKYRVCQRTCPCLSESRATQSL
jgi:type I site-specific restriction-modification system R (restriction) subunit